MKTILIVDDDAAVLDLFAQIALKLGYLVSRAASGEQALAMCHLKKYDILLTDKDMPGGMNGVQLANHLGELSLDERPGKIILATGDFLFNDEDAGPHVSRVLRKGTMETTGRLWEFLR